MSDLARKVVPFDVASREALKNARLEWLQRCPLGGDAGPTFWTLPGTLSRDDAIMLGAAIGEIGRWGGWWLGDWYCQCNASFGGMKELCEAAGVNYGTAKAYAVCCKAFPMLTRVNTVPFGHHQIVASLPYEEAVALLEWCRDADPMPTEQQLKTRLKQSRRAEREEELAEAIEQAAIGVGHQVYGVLYADPPWRFAPYSVEGMDRAADNHYPTMTRDALFDMEAMRTAPAKDCVLFCWATVPMLEDALEWMTEYGFSYRSHCVWVKDRPGTGYWFRNQHELLLVGVRGEVPAPAPGTQFPSVMEAPVGRHSEKPSAAAAMIEALFPTLPKLELFARAPRAGWDTWGAEAECPADDR